MRGDREFDADFDRLLGRAYRDAQRLVGDSATAEDLASRWRRHEPSVRSVAP